MFELAFMAALLGESRHVEISPGFETPSGQVEIDYVVIDPDGHGKVESTRGFAGNPSKYAADLPVGSRVTVVFSARNGQTRRHSIIGPVEITAGDEPLTLEARFEQRSPVKLKADAEKIRSNPRLLQVPIPAGAKVRDDRLTESKARGLAGHWAVPVATRYHIDRDTNEARFEGLLKDQLYTTLLNAPGREPLTLRIEPEDAEVTASLERVDALKLTVVTSKGEPIENAKIVARQRPNSEIRAFWPVVIASETAATTDKTGLAELTDLIGGKSYDLYIDAGEHGRSLVTKVHPGQTHQARLSVAPPLTVTIKNIPKSKIRQVTAGEKLSRENAITWIQHGPFPIDGTDLTVSLPAPIGKHIDFQVGGEDGWQKRLVINARGRAAVLDVANPANEQYVDSQLADPERTITLAFETASGGELPAIVQTGFSAKPLAGQFSVARRGPSDGEKASRSYRATRFQNAGPGRWSLAVPASEFVNIDLERIQVEGHLIDGPLSLRVRPGDDDIVFRIPLIKAVNYELVADDFIGQKFTAIRYPLSSVDYDRTNNNANWFSLSGTELQPSHISAPANRPSLLVLESQPNVFVRRLDGKAGTVRADWSKLKTTTLQAHTPDGQLLSTRIDGVVLPKSGITKPVDVRYESEVVGDLPEKSSISASRARLNLYSDEPVWAIVAGYGGDYTKQVVELTPGEHQDITMKPGRVLWIDQLNLNGSDFRFGGHSRLRLFHIDRNGVEIELASNLYEGRFYGVPESGKAVVRVYLEGFGTSEAEIELDGSDIMGLVVEVPFDDGDVLLTPQKQGSTGTRKKNREFYRKRNGK